MRLRHLALVTLVAVLAATACSGSGADDPVAGGAPTTAPPDEVADPASVPAAASTGCTDGTATAGREKVTTTSGGLERWYFRDVPTAYDGTTPMPVVLDLHGYSEGAEVHLQMSDLSTYGEEQGFVTITPHGQGDVPRWDVALDSIDLDYMGDLLDEIEATTCVDTNRIFVTGLSNGAFLTSAIACRYADRIAAAAPVAGIRDPNGCAPSRAVPVAAFHGTDDGFVTWDGGLGPAVADLPAPDGSGRTLGDIGELDPSVQGNSIMAITAAWAQRNGCDPDSNDEPVAGDVVLVTWDCPAGAEVMLYRVDGGGHSWPGSQFSAAVESVVGPTTFAVSANEAMWAFFTAHPLPG